MEIKALQVFVAASGRPDDKALVFASRALDSEENAPMLSLWKVPLRFRILSLRASKGLTEILTGELARRVAQMNEQTMLSGRTIPALVILRLISVWYYASSRGEAMYGLNELQRVELKGGNIEGFQNTWVMVLSGQKHNIEE